MQTQLPDKKKTYNRCTVQSDRHVRFIKRFSLNNPLHRQLIIILSFIRNRLISGGLEPVFIHTKKLCLA